MYRGLPVGLRLSQVKTEPSRPSCTTSSLSLRGGCAFSYAKVATANPFHWCLWNFHQNLQTQGRPVTQNPASSSPARLRLLQLTNLPRQPFLKHLRLFDLGVEHDDELRDPAHHIKSDHGSVLCKPAGAPVKPLLRTQNSDQTRPDPPTQDPSHATHHAGLEASICALPSTTADSVFV